MSSHHGTDMIRISPDLETLSLGAVALIIQQAAEAILKSGQFSLVLCGGQTPRRTYELLSQRPYRDQIDWSKIHVFWGDERCVQADDPRHNALMARRALLDLVPIPRPQIHWIRCHGYPAAEAQRYEKKLKEFFRNRPPAFDLILLGLGENGHTASLFPHTPVLNERRHWVAPVYIEAQDLFRVTLTPAIINQARVLVFLVSGSAKARVLRMVLQGLQNPQQLPAQLIQPDTGAIYWLVDVDAAGELSDIGSFERS